MRKVVIGLLSVLLITATACSSGTAQSTADSAGSYNNSKAAESEENVITSKALHNNIYTWNDSTYTNPELGFSFQIPKVWTANDYKIVVSHGKMEEDQSAYSKVSFIFRSDRENPVLNLMRVSKTWWNEQITQDLPHPEYLGEQKDYVYCAQLPHGCPYADEVLMEQYNSMVLTYDQVQQYFSLLESSDITYVDGTLLDFSSNYVTIQTQENQELTFAYSSWECSVDTTELQDGDAFRVYYKGEIQEESDTTQVTVVQISSLGTVGATISSEEYSSPAISDPS